MQREPVIPAVVPATDATDDFPQITLIVQRVEVARLPVATGGHRRVHRALQRLRRVEQATVRLEAASEINDLGDASTLLGHSKAEMTERVYRRVGAIAKPSK